MQNDGFSFRDSHSQGFMLMGEKGLCILVFAWVRVAAAYLQNSLFIEACMDLYQIRSTTATGKEGKDKKKGVTLIDLFQ